MILTNFLEIKIVNNNISYYKEKGYDCKINDILTIKVEDVSQTSSYKVLVKCDNPECSHTTEKLKEQNLAKKLYAELSS